MEIPFAKTVTLDTTAGFQFARLFPPTMRGGWVQSTATRMDAAGNATQIILQLVDQGSTLIDVNTTEDVDVVPRNTIGLSGSSTDLDDFTEFTDKQPFAGGLVVGGLVANAGAGGDEITVTVRGSYFT